MKMIKWFLIVVVVGVAVCIGCSQDSRDEIADRLENAGRALAGESSTGEKTPKIVKDQQRKERIRQNNTWTPENRAQHPVEYCQAQLEELQRYGRELEARAHEKSCAIAAVKRTLGDNETMAKNLSSLRMPRPPTRNARWRIAGQSTLVATRFQRKKREIK